MNFIDPLGDFGGRYVLGTVFRPIVDPVPIVAELVSVQNVAQLFVDVLLRG